MTLIVIITMKVSETNYQLINDLIKPVSAKQSPHVYRPERLYRDMFVLGAKVHEVPGRYCHDDKRLGYY